MTEPITGTAGPPEPPTHPAGPTEPPDDPARPPEPAGPSEPVPVTAGEVTRAGDPLATGLDRGLKILGWVVAAGLGFVLGLYGAFLAPMYLFGVRFPASLLLALVGNPLLAWFAYVVTGRRAAGLVPAAAWCAVWIMAATRTTEGDLLITENNWVGTATLLAGPLASAATIFFIVTRSVLRSGGQTR